MKREMSTAVRNNKREQAIKLLYASLIRLRKAEKIIVELNKDGEQFDYCNSSELSDATEDVYNKVGKINSIVFQLS